MKKIILFITLAVFLASCSSVPKDLKDENVTPEEFFQKAQEAVINWNRYKLAIAYYEEFMLRYPDMKNKIIEAEYEIAFIKYKQEKYDESEALFRQLLDKYETDEAIYYPEWPRVMAHKILAEIEKEKNKKSFFSWLKRK